MGGIPTPAGKAVLQQQREGVTPPPRVMHNAYASWYIMHIDGYVCISVGMHACPWICKHIHGYACLRDSSENTIIPSVCWFLMNCNYPEQKWKSWSKVDRKIEIRLGNIKSNPVCYWKPNMILWSLRSFWVERFDLNQSLKIDIWRKSFLDQCKNSAPNRLFPKSRLGQMTYRKLKPRPSWCLLHAPFHVFSIFS